MPELIPPHPAPRYRLLGAGGGWHATLREGSYAELIEHARECYRAEEFFCLDALGSDDHPGACPACAGADDPWLLAMTEGCRAGRSDFLHLQGPEDYTYLRLIRLTD